MTVHLTYVYCQYSLVSAKQLFVMAFTVGGITCLMLCKPLESPGRGDC